MSGHKYTKMSLRWPVWTSKCAYVHSWNTYSLSSHLQAGHTCTHLDVKDVEAQISFLFQWHTSSRNRLQCFYHKIYLNPLIIWTGGFFWMKRAYALSDFPSVCPTLVNTMSQEHLEGISSDMEKMTTCSQCTSFFKDELIQFEWAKVKGHRDLTKHILGHHWTIHTV